MDAAGALDEATVFLDHFQCLGDPRQRGKVVYPLDEVLLLSLLAVLAGAESFVDIARFGVKKLDLAVPIWVCVPGPSGVRWERYAWPTAETDQTCRARPTASQA